MNAPTKARQKPEMISGLAFLISALIAANVAAILLAKNISSESVDLVSHYSLVEFLNSRWGSWAHFAQIHSAMANYPSATHTAAAWIGKIVGSPFLGMQILAVSAVALSYVTLFSGILSRDVASSIAKSVMIVIAIFSFRQYHTFIGQELNGNYFFAQIVSSAASMAVLFWLSIRSRTTFEVIAVPCAVYIAGSFYPLAQLHIAAGGAALWLMSATSIRPTDLPAAARSIVCAVLQSVLCLAAFRFHHNYAFMNDVSENNGEIFASISIANLTIAAILLLVVSVYGISASTRRGSDVLLYPRFLPTFGFATSSAFLAHAAFYFFYGSGSDYAIKKHAYLIVTISVFYGCSLVIDAMFGRTGVSNRRVKLILAAWAIPTSCSIAVTIFISSQKSRSLSELLAAQGMVHELVIRDPSIYFRTISRVEMTERFDNFILSAVDLRIPDGPARLISLDGKSPLIFGIEQCIEGGSALIVSFCK